MADRQRTALVWASKSMFLEWQRYVGAQLTFHYDRRQIILEQTELSKGLAGRYVEVYDFSDKPLEVRWQGHLLPYRVFNKDQCVSPSAIVENKRLRHALSVVKTQQDRRLAVKVMTNSEKIGYKKQARRIYGADFDSKTPDAIEMTV
ncbi:MAG TPA: hypothetical protein VIX42_04745 [Edaphobacter sp.]